MRNRNFERGGSRKNGTRRVRKFWIVCAWILSISMILGNGNAGSYIVDADDEEAPVTEAPSETAETETQESAAPVLSATPEPVSTETYIPEATTEAVTAEPSPSAFPSPSIAPVIEATAEPAASASPEASPSATPYASMEPSASPEAAASAEPSPTPEASASPASMPAVSFEDTEETTGIKVSVKAEEGTFPEGTTMELSPVTDENVLNDAMEASSLEHAEAKAVDITFRDAAGNIIEPKKQIRVTMTADVIKDADTVDVVHVPDEEEKEENQSVQTEVVDQTADADLEENEKPAEDQVVFDADQFSVYAIVYTVDFTFSGYTYSIEGNSSILLSELASQLGLHDSERNIDFNINDVHDVIFSDSSLVNVEKQDNDYALTSLQPFTSDETLTITMNDGSRYAIDVTDEQETDLSQFLSSAKLIVDGKEFSGDAWTVRPEQSYEIELEFQEKDGLQFKNGGQLSYKLPNGIVVENQVGSFDIDVAGQTIKNNEFQVKDGYITVNFNTADSNYYLLTESENLKFYVRFSSEFDENTGKVIFRKDISKNIVIDTSHHVTVKKEGRFDWDDKKMHYTVTVNSQGHSENIVVNDTLTGTAVTLDKESIKLSDNKSYSLNRELTTDKGFSLTIPEMNNNETVEITYTASIDFTKVGKGSSISADKTSNGVKVSSDNDSTQDSSEYSHEIYYSPSELTKIQSSVSDIKTEGEQKYREVNWKINANSKNNVAFSYIKDSIKPDANGNYDMVYSGTGLFIEVIKEDGTKEQRPIEWTDGSIIKTNENGKFIGWEYKPPKSDGKASYLIKYSTKAKVQAGTSVTYRNEVDDDYNHQAVEVKILPDDSDTISITKQATKVSEESITWNIAVSVPAKGYNEFYVTDTLPSQYIGQQYTDEVESITVDGLIKDENWVRSDGTDKNNNKIVTLTFYQDADHTNPGLKATESNRTLNITVVTKNNQDWMKNASEPYQHDHTNKAVAGNGNITSEASDTETIYSKSISKSGKEDNSDGTHLIEYTVILTGLRSDSFSIDDKFDTSILQFDAKKAPKIYGGNQYDQHFPQGGTDVNVETTNTGIRITGNNVPKQASGAYYSHYKIVYYLSVNDKELNQKAFDDVVNDQKHTTLVTNTAFWDGISAKNNISYTYKPLDKVQKDYNENTNTIPYTITVNKEKVRLNKGNAMTLTDEFSNIYVDPKNVSYSTDPSEKSTDVKFDLVEGNKLVFTIPDETAVTINYYGYVLGKAGTTIQVTNTASLLDVDAVQKSTPTKKAYAGGSGDVCKVYLRKYEAGNYNHTLSGAVFELLDSDQNPILYGEKSSKKGQAVTFKTGSDGLATIYLSSEYDGVSLKFDKRYYLKEIQAPDGYEIRTDPIPFQISYTDNNPQADVYFALSNINVSDRRIEKVRISLHKGATDNPNIDLNGAVFSLYKAGSNGEFSKDSSLLLAEGLKTQDKGTVILSAKGESTLLESGTYYLIETQAPSGYEILPSPVKVTIADGKVTAGEREYSFNTDSSGINSATIDIDDSPKTQLIFYKQWRKEGAVIKWPADVENIKVTLHGVFQSSDSSLKIERTFPLTLSSTGSSSSGKEEDVTWAVESQDDRSYKYTVGNLPASIFTDENGNHYSGTWTYTVTEDKQENYDTFYAQSSGENNDIQIDLGKKSAGNGDYIINKPIDRYSLPVTGGPGAKNITSMGLILLTLGAFLMVRKLLIIKNDGPGGDAV